MNYKIPQMGFKYTEGKSIVLKSMNTYPSQLIYANNMRSILIHEDIEWDIGFHISTEGTTIKVSYNPNDIKSCYTSTMGFLKTFHMEGHLTVALNTKLSWKLVHFQ